MKSPIPTPVRAWAIKAGLTLSAAVALAVGSTAALSAASAARVPGGGTTANPYSPAYGHPYRHGAVPTLRAAAAMRSWAAGHRVPAVSANNLNYGGGIDGSG